MDRYIGIDVRAASRMIGVVHARGKQVGSRVVTCTSPKRDPRSVTCQRWWPQQESADVGGRMQSGGRP
jgi:hypothetical protein